MSTLIKYKNGQQEPLTLAPLSNTEQCRFFNLLIAEDTPGIIMLCTRRNGVWVDSLDQDSFLELTNKFIKENFTMAMRLALANPIAGARMGPLIRQLGNFMAQLPAEEQAAIADLVKSSSSAPPATSSPTATNASPNSSASPSAPPPAAAALAT